MAQFLTVQGKGDLRDIINGLGANQREGYTRGNPVIVCLELVHHLQQAVFHIFAHQETDADHGEAGRRCTVNIFHAGNLPHQLLNGNRDLGFHLLCICSWILDKDVNHGNHDLRLFFPGSDDQGKNPQQQRQGNHQRDQFGVNKRTGDATRNPGPGAHCVGSSLQPSWMAWRFFTAIRSPPARPEITSIPSVSLRPVRTSRNWARPSFDPTRYTNWRAPR